MSPVMVDSSAWSSTIDKFAKLELTWLSHQILKPIQMLACSLVVTAWRRRSLTLCLICFLQKNKIPLSCWHSILSLNRIISLLSLSLITEKPHDKHRIWVTNHYHPLQALVIAIKIWCLQCMHEQQKPWGLQTWKVLPNTHTPCLPPEPCSDLSPHQHHHHHYFFQICKQYRN